jgi:putative alpha-1,2-mannosidase
MNFRNLKIRFSMFFGGAALLFAASVFAQNQPKDFTRYVNPFIGTGGHGHTFPGATVPFGMVQLSPDTREDNWRLNIHHILRVNFARHARR